MIVGRWLCGPAWFGPDREWAALALSLLLTLFHRSVGRRLLQKHVRPGDQSRRSLNTGQVIAVVVIAVAGGTFGTWLFCKGPGL
jgi:hypothetical protein